MDLIQSVTTTKKKKKKKKKKKREIPLRYGAQIKPLVKEVKGGEGVLDLGQKRAVEMKTKIEKFFHYLTCSSAYQVGSGNDLDFLMDMKHLK
ncbi:hypothetical protein N7534_007872 [Penicillium rubens]|nr:hypothetical protein N7534_007872 [Penicillium rubens]